MKKLFKFAFAAIAITSLFAIPNKNTNNELVWANAKIEGNNITIQDDFTSLPSGVALSNGNIKSSNVFEDSNVLALGKSWMGAFPCSDNQEKNSYNTTNGYLTYKMESGKSGLYIKNAKLDFSLGITINGLYNNSYFSSSMGKANVTIEVSEDNLIFEDVYNFLNDESLYQDGKNPFMASNYNAGALKKYEDTKTIVYSDYSINGFVTYNLSVDLSSYCAECLYIRINMIHCKPSEIKSSSSTLEPSDIAERLYKVNLSCQTSTVGLTESGYYIFDNFRNDSQKMGNLSGKFTNLTTEGSIAHGLIPSYEWGGSVNAGNGSIIYEIPVNGNGLFSTFSSLNMKMTYFLTGNNHSDILISAGFSLDNLQQLCSVKEQFGLANTSNLMYLDLTKIATGTDFINGTSSIDEDILFIKVDLIHDSGYFSLGNLGAKIFDLSFKGKLNFAMNVNPSLKVSEDEFGLRFATLIDKSVLNILINGGYNLKCGTLIMPYDYLGYYGELNENNVFSSNAVYSLKEDETKPQIIYSYAKNESFSSNFDVFYAALTNISKENIARNFIARGVIEASKDGNTKYLFANYSNGNVSNNMFNMFDIAKQIATETSDYYLKSKLQNKYIDNVGEVVAKYTAIDVYYYKDGTTYMITKRTNYNLVGTDVTINLDTQATGTMLSDGVILGGKTYKYYDELPSSVGVTHFSNISGYVRADGKLTLVRYYQEQA